MYMFTYALHSEIITSTARTVLIGKHAVCVTVSCLNIQKTLVAFWLILLWLQPRHKRVVFVVRFRLRFRFLRTCQTDRSLRRGIHRHILIVAHHTPIAVCSGPHPKCGVNKWTWEKQAQPIARSSCASAKDQGHRYTNTHRHASSQVTIIIIYEPYRSWACG